MPRGLRTSPRRAGLGFARLSLSDPESLGGWTTVHARLEPTDLAELEQALTKSAAFAPPPAGMNLASEEFYWIFVGCRDGKVIFNAWRYGGDRFAALAFPAVLLRHDATGVAINAPRDAGLIDRTKSRRNRQSTTPRFDLAIGANGLLGLVPRI